MPSARAQLSLSVTPPLFQITIQPGTDWASSIKAINPNPYEIVVRAEAVNFTAEGEGGHGRFVPIRDVPDENTLAGWIDIGAGDIVIPPEKTVDVPFTIRVPENASPGGHYAAVFIGTRPPQASLAPGGPPQESGAGPAIRVSSSVTSLIFVRIPGNVVEAGSIIDFVSENLFYQKPDVTFNLRFENTGNVHLRPQGDITIYTMWGRERGKIFINEKTEFGNVLPESVRKFNFQWKGEESIFDAGRYRAVATLTYGVENRQNVSRETIFWVVPVRPLLIIGGIIFFSLLFFVWGIRRYIRRALALEAARRGFFQPQNSSEVGTGAVPVPDMIPKIKMLTLPLREGVVDLRNVVLKRQISNPFPHPPIDLKNRQAFTEKSAQDEDRNNNRGAVRTWHAFFKKYWMFVVFLVLLAAGIFVIAQYKKEAFRRIRPFEIIIHNDNM